MKRPKPKRSRRSKPKAVAPQTPPTSAPPPLWIPSGSSEFGVPREHRDAAPRIDEDVRIAERLP